MCEGSIVQFGNGVTGSQLWVLYVVGCCVECASGVLINGDMIGMPIASGFVECDEDLRAELTNDSNQLADYLGGPGMNECMRVLIRCSIFHAGIAISQEPEVVYMQDLSGCTHLSLSYLPQAFGRSLPLSFHLSSLSSFPSDTS